MAGIDFSTKAVDVVLLDEDTDAATWHRFELVGHDAFQRARSVKTHGPLRSFWDDVLACGIEDPRGYNAGALYRIQGGILACLPPRLLVQPWIPSAWRKTVGLPGNASKAQVRQYVTLGGLGTLARDFQPDWPSDPCDAYCIALATRSLIELGKAA